MAFSACAAGDLYKAFCKWCDVEGEKFVANNTIFGREISRFIDKIPDQWVYFGVKRSSVSIYLPVPLPPHGVMPDSVKKDIENQCLNFREDLQDWSK